MPLDRDMKIIVAVTGASGAIYARQLLDALVASPQVKRIALIVSRRGAEVAEWEGIVLPENKKIERLDNDAMFASVASGSAEWNGMIIVPCSMGTLGRVANAVSSDLISRAADVMLKERRRLIVVPRETPLHTIHLRNMTALSECGALVLPAAPSFYSRPQDVESACRTVTERVLSLLGIQTERYRWGE